MRNQLMSFLTGLPGIEERLGEGLSGIAVNYRHSPIVEEYGSELAGPAAGDRAPDALLVDPRSAALRLYDLFTEHRHVLLLLGAAQLSHATLLQCLQHRPSAIEALCRLALLVIPATFCRPLGRPPGLGG